jgi:hypothetical protein
MTNKPARPADNWAPLYFLASVGAGGLAVTFFMWLMFWVPHPGQPVPVFEDIARAFANGGLLSKAMIIGAALGIAGFAYLNIKMYVWNVGQMLRFKKTESYAKLMTTNAESQMAAFPLATAMLINALFVLGLVFVPGLWSVVEYLFPLAMIAFLAVGYITLKQLGAFYGRIFGQGGFNTAANNNFGQALPAFALAMTGVGLSAPAALSGSVTVAGISVVVSTFFFVASALIAVIAIFQGIRDMMQHGASIDTAPTLTIVVPLITILGILTLRQSHGLHVHFESHAAVGDVLVTLTQFVSIQLLFLGLGWAVLSRQGYYKRFIAGADNSVGSYALVCPGVAMSVMLQFWINKGLVEAGVLAKFSTGYWVLSAVAVAFQIAMIALVFTLNRKHFAAPRTTVAVPAE